MSKRGPKPSAERDAKIQAAKELRATGWTFAAIGRLLGVTDTAVSRWLTDGYAARRAEMAAARRAGRVPKREPVAGPERKELPPPPKNINVAAEIVSLRSRGYSRSAIAAILHVTYRQVEEALR